MTDFLSSVFFIFTGKCYARFVYPIRYLSTSLAQSLPCLIAFTTSDWPVWQSPAANTPATLVANFPSSVLMLVLWFTSTPNASVRYFWVPRKPAAIRTSSQGSSFSAQSTGTIILLPVASSTFDSSWTVTTLQSLPFLSFLNSFTVVVYILGSCPNTAIASS